MKEGIQKGIELGKMEVYNKAKSDGEVSKLLEIARNLKKLDVPIDMIIKSTELTKEEIEKL